MKKIMVVSLAIVRCFPHRALGQENRKAEGHLLPATICERGLAGPPTPRLARLRNLRPPAFWYSEESARIRQ